MKHAFLVLSSYGLDYLKCFLEQFKNDEDFYFFIHLDNKSLYDYNDNGVFFDEFKNIIYKDHIKRCRRFSLNMCDIMIELIRKAYNSNYDFSFFHIISESCYLIKPINEFKNFFINNEEKSFMPYEYFFGCKIGRKLIYKSSQWFTLNRYIVSQLLKDEYLNEYNEYKNMYLNNILTLRSCALDECIIQNTILINILKNNRELFKKYIINDSLRYVKWDNNKDNCGHPYILEYKNKDLFDIKEILESKFFIRKINIKNKDSVKFKNYIIEKYKDKHGFK